MYTGEDPPEGPPFRELETVDIPAVKEEVEDEEDVWDTEFPEDDWFVLQLMGLYGTERLFSRTRWGQLILAMNKNMC